MLIFVKYANFNKVDQPHRKWQEEECAELLKLLKFKY